MSARQKQLLTLCFILEKDRVLLALKKRGFGEGKWNGYGGKVHEGETIEDAAKREMMEESTITVEHLSKRAVLTFEFENDPVLQEAHVFVIERYTGTPVETEEMRPRWFAHGDIPFHDMWVDDPFWFHHLLGGKMFRGYFFFKDQSTLTRYTVEEVVNIVDVVPYV